jgi:hypothetical protein
METDMSERLLIAELQRLERAQGRSNAFAPDGRRYEFRVTPSCPPSKEIYISGGIATPSSNWFSILDHDFIPTVTCDFEDEDQTGMALSFTNADYYLPILLRYHGDWVCSNYADPAYSDPVFDNAVGTECATAVEAEAQIDLFLNGGTSLYYTMPLHGVILRNDGRTGIKFAILQVDAMNQGNSYLYRDARAWHGIFP